MKLMKDFIDILMSPRVISDSSRHVESGAQRVVFEILFPVIFPGYKRPTLRARKIEHFSYRRSEKTGPG